MSRTQLVLGGALLLQVLLILVLRSPFSETAAGTEARQLLPVLEAITPARVEIRGTPEETITLNRQEGHWRLEQVGGFPADDSKVEDLLEDLKSLKVRRPVVSSSRYHTTFKVEEDEHEGRILLWDEGDEPKVDLLLGSSPNYRVTHVRPVGRDEVYEVRGLASYEVRPDASAWIEHELVDVEPESVSRLVLTNAAGRLELQKLEGVWKSVGAADEDRELDASKVEGFLRKATSVRLADATGPLDETGHGFADPAATLTLHWSAGDEQGERELTIRVGSTIEGEDSKRYITRSGFGFTGTVWESSVNQLLDGKLDELYAGADVSG